MTLLDGNCHLEIRSSLILNTACKSISLSPHALENKENASFPLKKLNLFFFPLLHRSQDVDPLFALLYLPVQQRLHLYLSSRSLVVQNLHACIAKLVVHSISSRFPHASFSSPSPVFSLVSSLLIQASAPSSVPLFLPRLLSEATGGDILWVFPGC